MAQLTEAERYERHREYVRERARSAHAAASDIGEIPQVKNENRRKECGDSFRLFCETYRPAAFCNGWSDDHLRVIERVERTVKEGGLFALAMPRGNGKTTITVTAGLWALLYGFRKWVCLIGATQDKAVSLLDGIKTEIRFNQLLLDDFPEIVVPVRKLEGKAARANSQTHLGVPTNITWSADKVVFPAIQGSPSSGSVITVAGITGDIRGQQQTTADGRIIRPDYVLLDDPQTRESAKSNTQTDDRIATLNGDILGLAGPTTKIAGVMPCTVIRRGDMADEMLDREKAPEWHGERTKLVYGWPKNFDHWNTYQEIRERCWRNGLNTQEATDYYSINQVKMDEGITAAWNERKTDKQISGVQYAMDLYFRDPAAFWAEYQNEPLEDTAVDNLLTEEAIAARVGAYESGVVPLDTEHLVAFVDVQGELLFYVVTAWRKDFTGQVIQYGAWPDQKTTNFTLKDARYTFSKQWPELSPEARIRRALKDLCDYLENREWKTEDGEVVPLRRLLVDANWGQHRNLVFEFCKVRARGGVVMASLGKAIGPASQPLNATHTKKFGRTVGTHWRIEKAKDAPVRNVLWDTNYWKSFFHSRLSTEPGSVGSLTLYYAEPRIHKTFAHQMRSEYPTRTAGLNREVDVWKLKPDKPDNHWFDCAVGCCVAASMEGCSIAGQIGKKVNTPKATPRPHSDSPAVSPITNPVDEVTRTNNEATRRAVTRCKRKRGSSPL